LPFNVFVALLNSATGTVVATSDFNQLQSGHFGGYANGIDSRLPPLTIDGVTFTFTPSGSSGQHNGGVSFPFTAASSGSDPAVQAFFGRLFSGPPETFIDFSQPLYAFGVTFIVGGGSFPEDEALPKNSHAVAICCDSILVIFMISWLDTNF
jgi:hypothetical protein